MGRGAVEAHPPTNFFAVAKPYSVRVKEEAKWPSHLTKLTQLASELKMSGCLRL